jgi:hypothetical protein
MGSEAERVMTARTLRGYTQNEIKFREIDRRRADHWYRVKRNAELEADATRKRIERVKREKRAERVSATALESIPLHESAHRDDVNVTPRASEAIHCREVLDLMPVIEDQHFDPLFDGDGTTGIDAEWFLFTRQKKFGLRHQKAKWQRQLMHHKVRS